MERPSAPFFPGGKAPWLRLCLEPKLQRYADVGLEAKPSKVHAYASTQVLLGYQLDDNELFLQPCRYWDLVRRVDALDRRGYAQPREVESIVSAMTHAMLLHRLSLSVFGAVYAFAQKCGSRTVRVWPSVLTELRRALAILPLVRADLGRPVSELLLQTDACETGGGVV